MKISKFIKNLEKVKEEMGDVHIIGLDVGNDFMTYKIELSVDNNRNEYLDDILGERTRVRLGFNDDLETEFNFSLI